jgi:hypothetical protein
MGLRIRGEKDLTMRLLASPAPSGCGREYILVRQQGRSMEPLNGAIRRVKFARSRAGRLSPRRALG